jgi:predicted hotdog family 3-hydroxylacyl-ACP dehydratase
MADFPHLAALLPHAGPMRLLERVLAHDALETRCSVAPGGGAGFADGAGRLPAWWAIEWMAQCAAVDGSLRGRARGEAPRAALFVGSRRVAFAVDAFDGSARLEVTARHAAGRPGGGLLAFDCAVRESGRDAVLAEGRLNVLPGDFA